MLEARGNKKENVSLSMKKFLPASLALLLFACNDAATPKPINDTIEPIKELPKATMVDTPKPIAADTPKKVIDTLPVTTRMHAAKTIQRKTMPAKKGVTPKKQAHLDSNAIREANHLPIRNDQ